MHAPVSILVFGAGSIGCYLGGCLAAAGAKVTLVGRERVISAIRNNGLTVSDYLGRMQHVPASALALTTGLDALNSGPRHYDAVLVTVKSAATETAASELATHLAPETVVISFQNGIDNADRLQTGLAGARILSGMVPFNVIDRGLGRFHQGSAGELEVEAHADSPVSDVDAVFAKAGLSLKRPADMAAVRWGKLLLNLNNPVNALSGLPLRDELAQRSYRRCVALAQREALALMTSAGIKPARVTPLPPAWLAKLLDTPDWLFTRAAKRMLAIDPLARSSMWEDLEAGRTTEIDWINGEVVRLARKTGRPAPVNERLCQLIRAAEAGGKRDWTGDALLAELTKAASSN